MATHKFVADVTPSSPPPGHRYDYLWYNADDEYKTPLSTEREMYVNIPDDTEVTFIVEVTEVRESDGAVTCEGEDEYTVRTGQEGCGLFAAVGATATAMNPGSWDMVMIPSIQGFPLPVEPVHVEWDVFTPPATTGSKYYSVGKETSVNVSGLSYDTPYHIRMKAVDARGCEATGDHVISVTQCPAGYEYVDGECLPACPPGYERVGGVCVPICPPGYHLEDGVCVPDEEWDPGINCPVPVLEEFRQPCGLEMSDEMKAHLSKSPTTLCVNWRVERRDGVVFGFTSHVDDLVFDGITYRSSLGLTPSGYQNSASLTVDNMEVMAVFDDDNITDRDILSGLYDDARVEVFLLNYEDVSMGKISGPVGYMGKLSRKEGNFIAEVREVGQKLNLDVLPKVSERCRIRRLGDPGCNVNLGGKTKDGHNITAQGWVTSADTRASFSSNFSTLALPPYAQSQQYSWESVTFTSGKNKNRIYGLVSFDGNKAVLYDDELNEVKKIRKGDKGAINAVRLSDSQPVSFDFTVASYIYNSQEKSFSVKSSFWNDGVPPSGDESFPQDHFRYGVVKFTSGENYGIEREVRQFLQDGRFEMAEAFPFNIEPNDHFVAVAGCDGRAETCYGKFDNMINFRGEPHVPGIEKSLEVRS